MYDESIKKSIQKYTGKSDFNDFFFPIYKTYIENCINKADEADKPDIIRRIENGEEPVEWKKNMIKSCKLLFDRKHGLRFIKTFMEYYHGDYDQGITDVYYQLFKNRAFENIKKLKICLQENKPIEQEDKTIEQEAIADAKSTGLSDKAAEVYANSLADLNSETFSRKKAENYDYVYNKALKNKKSQLYAKIFAEKITNGEDEEYCAFYAEMHERAWLVKQLLTDKERWSFIDKLEDLNVESCNYFLRFAHTITDYKKPGYDPREEVDLHYYWDQAIAEVVGERLAKEHNDKTLVTKYFNEYIGLMSDYPETCRDDALRDDCFEKALTTVFENKVKPKKTIKKQIKPHKRAERIKCPMETDPDYDEEHFSDSEGLNWYCYNCEYNSCCSEDRNPHPDRDEDEEDEF